jgi:hypothetical protein
LRLPVTGPSPTDVTIGHNVVSKAEVDAVMSQANAAGATIVKPAQDTFFGGYAGYLLPGSRPASLGGRMESSASAAGLR